jgi:hypothetical protein
VHSLVIECHTHSIDVGNQLKSGGGRHLFAFKAIPEDNQNFRITQNEPHLGGQDSSSAYAEWPLP